MHMWIAGLAAILALATNAQAMTVKLADINGKTNLATAATASVNGHAETILVDAAGLSVYTFELDRAGVSNCSGGCLKEWPILHVPAGSTVTAPFGVIRGNDGQDQLTLNGLPLYYYADDAKPGDAFGQYPQWDVILVER